MPVGVLTPPSLYRPDACQPLPPPPRPQERPSEIASPLEGTAWQGLPPPQPSMFASAAPSPSPSPIQSPKSSPAWPMLAHTTVLATPPRDISETLPQHAISTPARGTSDIHHHVSPCTLAGRKRAGLMERCLQAPPGVLSVPVRKPAEAETPTQKLRRESTRTDADVGAGTGAGIDVNAGRSQDVHTWIDGSPWDPWPSPRELRASPIDERLARIRHTMAALGPPPRSPPLPSSCSPPESSSLRGLPSDHRAAEEARQVRDLRLRHAFSAADRDHNGALSKRELYNALSLLGLHYTPSEQLRVWRSARGFDGGSGKSSPPHNLHLVAWADFHLLTTKLLSQQPAVRHRHVGLRQNVKNSDMSGFASTQRQRCGPLVS